MPDYNDMAHVAARLVLYAASREARGRWLPPRLDPSDGPGEMERKKSRQRDNVEKDFIAHEKGRQACQILGIWQASQDRRVRSDSLDAAKTWVTAIEILE